jgi:small redox-active disulfide protein 2
MEKMTLVQILGPGCARCEALHKNAAEAVRQLGLDAQVEKITDLNTILGFGVMMTPALAINGEVKLQGKVASVAEIKELLSSTTSL